MVPPTPDIARDHGVIDLLTHEFAHVGYDLAGEIVARVEHGQDDAVDAQFRIESLLELPTVFRSCDRPSRGEELTLQRHQDGVRSCHGVDGQQIK